MNNSVFDILVYVFDHYLFGEASGHSGRESLARDLEDAGFAGVEVDRALDWISDLATHDARIFPCGNDSVRIYSDQEQRILGPESRGMLMSMEANGSITAAQREAVIELLSALGTDEIGPEQVEWVVCMVLSSQPRPETPSGISAHQSGYISLSGVPH